VTSVTLCLGAVTPRHAVVSRFAAALKVHRKP
jgi:hypothetical protein